MPSTAAERPQTGRSILRDAPDAPKLRFGHVRGHLSAELLRGPELSGHYALETFPTKMDAGRAYAGSTRPFILYDPSLGLNLRLEAGHRLARAVRADDRNVVIRMVVARDDAVCRHFSLYHAPPR
jgi:hypothetical protein